MTAAPDDDADPRHMRAAIELARASVDAGGGPFGAVVVLGGRVLGRGRNRVVEAGDPTAHAEVEAVREACRALGTHDLSGATVHTSCEPCPMCLGALCWARVARVYFGATREDAAAIGFDDERLYLELARPLDERELPLVPLLHDEALAPMRAWREDPGRRPY